MARFYGEIKGQRGEASRLGSAKSGISGHVRGWDIGCAVECYVGEDGEDRVRIELTGGSNGEHSGRSLGVFRVTDLEK